MKSFFLLFVLFVITAAASADVISHEEIVEREDFMRHEDFLRHDEMAVPEGIISGEDEAESSVDLSSGEASSDEVDTSDEGAFEEILNDEQATLLEEEAPEQETFTDEVAPAEEIEAIKYEEVPVMEEFENVEEDVFSEEISNDLGPTPEEEAMLAEIKSGEVAYEEIIALMATLDQETTPDQETTSVIAEREQKTKPTTNIVQQSLRKLFYPITYVFEALVSTIGRIFSFFFGKRASK